ncbi:FtsB family cell division protein [Amycolatopsis sp. H20-H5]|uniref:FtsB family cell division protein n=1 Tax=Amycolatopsis sp. H20-H5 TaxID=3046309 RepID=UPI002DBBCC6B|nr:septum formation initiator family protein [Amycolatopsis sp. H20-H5]MEC3975960.1 septum formation initiator family protein [Amycolatopsis sp. H20-H5]
MADRGRARSRGTRTGGAASTRARRPERGRRGSAEDTRTRFRRGLAAKRASGAAKVLGMSTTRRAAVVAIVVCALAFTIAVPLRTYLSQKSEVTQQQNDQAALQREVAQLQARRDELSDPAQIEAEARRRLRFVKPGETPYIVQLPEDKAPAQAPAPGQQAVPKGSWYEKLWDQVAGF